MKQQALVVGAGGFIGHHMVNYLKSKGYRVRGADLQEPAFEQSKADEFEIADLRVWDQCLHITSGIDEIYNLAADMGGIGYITSNHAGIARNNVLINANLLEAARVNDLKRFFFASSACVYPKYRQESPDITPLKEEDAYPAEPEDGYGEEKLFSERLCEFYYRDYGLETRVARFHNVYGPLGTYDGGKEKAPAAICRKIALADDEDEIEVWGDGKQTRSFMYVDDCVEGIFRITQSEVHDPLNLGSDEMVTINELVDMVARIAGKNIGKRHDISKPQGVRGRNSDNSRLQKELNWTPSAPLSTGLIPTYQWIKGALEGEGRPQAHSDLTGADAR